MSGGIIELLETRPSETKTYLTHERVTPEICDESIDMEVPPVGVVVNYMPQVNRV